MCKTRVQKCAYTEMCHPTNKWFSKKCLHAVEQMHHDVCTLWIIKVSDGLFLFLLWEAEMFRGT